MPNKILVIDDDSYINELLVNFLSQKGYKTHGALSGNKGIELLEKNLFNLVLCDYRLPDSDGLSILKHIKKHASKTPVVIMTAYADVKMAVKLIKNGALDYVTKPIQPDEILDIVKNIDKATPRIPGNTDFGAEFISGNSPKIKEVLKHIKTVAPTELTVLLEGETGTGKEYLARAIHRQSKRKSKPFVAVDCGSIPNELASSELFGHVKGSFTGAINDKQGVFEQAKGGTLFLDEIGNLPYENQVKLLRALQEYEITKVGDNTPIKTDVRLIAATNEDLSKQINNNLFREDLYHRVNEFKINVPPLRYRADDIDAFTAHFVQQANHKFNKNIEGVTPDVQQLFYKYPWYGNIRELKNIITRAVLLAQNQQIAVGDLPEEIINTAPAVNKSTNETLPDGITNLKEAMELTEREVIQNALEQADNNKAEAARLLNIDRKTLYNKLKQYNFDN